MRRLAQSQNPVVVAVGEDPPLSTEMPVERLGDPDEEPLNTTRQSLPPRRLTDHVDVVRLNGDFDHAKTSPLGARRESTANDPKAVATTQ